MDSDDTVKDSKEAAGIHKQKVLEEPNNNKVEVKQEGHKESIRKRPGRRLKMKATKKSKRQKTDVDLKEEEQLRAYLKIVTDEEGIIDYEVLERRFPIINWESKFYDFDRHGVECIYYRIFRSDGSSRWIKTFSEMVTRFDSLDLVELYTLVMKRFETTTPEEDSIEIHMLAKMKYPLTKETFERMLSLRLVARTASEDAYTLFRFIKKQIDEHQELASPKQTALGKDISNPLIVDSLLKTIWLSMYHVIAIKHWLFQRKWLLIYSMAGSDDEIPPPPPQTPTQQAPHTVSTIKLPTLKKDEYDIWAMKMEHYLSHTDYPIWEVIQKGNGP
ncbi:hypothetical protein Tco_1433990, partial [Tanacetum coccineum]